MKIGLLQLNATIGDFGGNADKLLSAYRRAVEKGADIVVAPELFLSGYPPRDLVCRGDFMEANQRALAGVVEGVGRVPLVVGTLMPRAELGGKPLYNSAVVLANKRVKKTFHKCLLPSYDVFDEARYFQPAKKPGFWNDKGNKIGVTICEDAWNDADFWPSRIYTDDPVQNLVNKGAGLILNLSASPWHAGKEALREAMFSQIARDESVPLVHVNMVGGNDELLFDGQSMVFSARGELIFKGKAFEEEVAVVDINDAGLAESPRPAEEELLFKGLAMGVRDYVEKCGFQEVVLGLSGGIDSALTAVIAVEALGPERVMGVALPSEFSSQHSLDDAEQLARTLEIEFLKMPIQPVFERALEQLEPVFGGKPADASEENLQARIRGLLLMGISNKTGRLLLTTGNKSELAVGYCTLYGDMCGGLAVISDVLKTQVYQLARWINRGSEIIPRNSIEKPPSAELRPDQTDQDSLPPYDVLDEILKAYVVEEKGGAEILRLGYPEDVVLDVLRKVDVNEYKRRQAAPGLKVSPLAFGVGRRTPIAKALC